MAAVAPTFDSPKLLAKCGPKGTELGDCPFTMKANLALRFKQVEFDVALVDLLNKPKWFLDLNEDGSTPTYVDCDTIITSSDEIVEYADKVGRNKSLTLIDESNPNWSGAYDVIAPLFGAFAKLMTNKDESQDGALSFKLLAFLKDVDTYLAKAGSTFLLGDSVSALDCNLAPKLEHIMIAGRHFKKLEIPKELTALSKYMETMRATEEWAACSCPDDVIIWGWGKFF